MNRMAFFLLALSVLPSLSQAQNAQRARDVDAIVATCKPQKDAFIQEIFDYADKTPQAEKDAKRPQLESGFRQMVEELMPATREQLVEHRRGAMSVTSTRERNWTACIIDARLAQLNGGSVTTAKSVPALGDCASLGKGKGYSGDQLAAYIHDCSAVNAKTKTVSAETSTKTSKIIHDPGLVATGCVAISYRNHRWAEDKAGITELKNNCGKTVTVFYCQGPECSANRGHSWTEKPGEVMTATGTVTHWGACFGRQSGGLTPGSNGTKFRCTEGLKG